MLHHSGAVTAVIGLSSTEHLVGHQRSGEQRGEEPRAPLPHLCPSGEEKVPLSSGQSSTGAAWSVRSGRGH